MDNSHLIQKWSRRVSFLTLIGVVLMVLSFGFFLAFSTKQSNEIESLDSAIVELKDTLRKKDSLYNMEKGAPIDSARHIIERYIHLRNMHRVDSLEMLYADTLIRYYRDLEHAHKSVVSRSDKKYWQVYPHDLFVISDTITTINDNGIRKGFAIGSHCRESNQCRDVIVEFGFDDNMRINYVRSFYADTNSTRVTFGGVETKREQDTLRRPPLNRNQKRGIVSDTGKPSKRVFGVQR